MGSVRWSTPIATTNLGYREPPLAPRRQVRKTRLTPAGMLKVVPGGEPALEPAPAPLPMPQQPLSLIPNCISRFLRLISGAFGPRLPADPLPATLSPPRRRNRVTN